MNDEELLQEASKLAQPEATKEAAELEAALKPEEKQQEQVVEEQAKEARGFNPFTKQFWLGDENATEEDYGFTNVTNPNDLRFTSDVEGISKDPRAAIEYYAAPATGALDTAIGLYNVSTPGPDIPYLPQFEDKGAQLTRDLSSLILPGMGAGGLIGKVPGMLPKAGKLGAFLRDPLVKYLGTNAAKLGTGAVIDLAAPIQGDTEGQTLIGSLYDISPRHMGWIPEDLRILASDGPDDARRKNMLEGAGFGAFGALVEGAVGLLRGKKGLRAATEYIPENEKASSYFAANKVEAPEKLEDIVDTNAFKREVDLDELGSYKAFKEQYKGYSPEELDEMVIFGRDTEMYGPFETGVRSADDFGVVGAMVDNARISGNVDSVYGRIRNPLSPAALEFANDTPGGLNQIITGLGKQLDEAGRFSFRSPTGKLISSKSLGEEADKLVARMLDMPLKDLQKTLMEGGRLKDGIPVMSASMAKATKKAIEVGLAQFADISKLRATALLDSSLAGQVADMATGMRLYDGGESALRLQDQLLDRIQMLQTLRGATAYGRNRVVRDRSIWSKLTGANTLKGDDKLSREIADQLTGSTIEADEVMTLIQEDSKQFVSSLRNVAKDRPNFLMPMAQLYELTDGDARSVSYLNNYLRNSTGTITKAVVDGQPEIPSVIMQGFWATLFNSALSGAKTPLKAGVSNAFTWAIKPATEIAGAYLTGNKSQLNRAFYAYSGVMDTISESFDYAKRMFVKSAQDPHVMRGRDELVYKTDEQMQLFKTTADAALAEGNAGPAVLHDIMQTQKDLAEHPWLRMGNRLMQFGDAWQTSQNAQFIAKMRAYDEFTQNGLKELNQAQVDQIAARVYSDMFDERGIIRDTQTLETTAKQVFSQDNPVSKSFQDIMQRIPGLKPFFMFTRSPINSLSYGASFAPVGAFTDKLSKFGKPFEEVPMEKVKRLLSEEGVDLKSGINPQAEYTRIRNEYKGRAAVGTSLVMMGVYGYLSGNITGRAGLYDKKKQAARVKNSSWKPMKAFGVDYSQIPAVSDWLSLTIDIMDNIFAMDQADAGELLRAMGHVIGANITERTMLQNIEQFGDVLQGNPASIQRWAVNVGFSSTTLVGGMLGTMNQVMAPQLKAVEQRLDQLLLNRIPGKPGLPDDYDYIDGGQVGTVDNPVLRLYNAFSPFPYHAQPSGAKKYLIDVEYDAELSMSSRSDGVPYTKAELAQIKKLMGEDGYFKKEILKIESRFPADKFRAKYADTTNKGLTPDVSTLDGVHARIARAQELAKIRAEAKLPDLMRKKREQSYASRGTGAYLQSGDVEGAQQFLENLQRKGLY